MAGVSITNLIKLTKTDISSKQLLRYFYEFLDRSPKHKKLNKQQHINLKVDAKYFGELGCTIVFKERKNIIYWDFVEDETYQTYTQSFNQLINLGYIVDSVTSDKYRAIVGSVRDLFPNIPHQHCMVHIQRSCETYLTKNPETIAGQKLLEIVKFTNQIKTENEKKVFLAWFTRYENEWKTFINQKTYPTNLTSNEKPWYTHKNLRKAFRILKNSQNNMFFYLDDINIPKDTNGLEAEFTHLKNKVNAHRGLLQKRVINFVNWYWFFKSKK